MAGLKIVLPVPPKIAFPKNTPKPAPTPTIHKGKVGGTIKANNIGVTIQPISSFFFLNFANASSMIIDTAYDTAAIASTYAPKINAAAMSKIPPAAVKIS